MSRRTADDIADELTNRITARIDACAEGVKGVEVLIAGTRMHSTSDGFRALIERSYWDMHQRGIRPGVLQQVIRNVEAWVRYGPPVGGERGRGRRRVARPDRAAPQGPHAGRGRARPAGDAVHRGRVMPCTCSICSHGAHQAIDAALLAGELSNGRIASQIDISERAVRSHKANHRMGGGT